MPTRHEGTEMADKRENRTSEAPAVYRSYFTPPFPVRTTVGSDLMNILVEIDFVAYGGR